MQSVEEAGAWLESLINVERRPDWPYARLGLAPIRRLLERLGEPHRDLSLIHVAGSKGKGSTALFAEALLTACGERVGTFTSPHLERWTERVRVDGREVEGERLAAALGRIRPHVEALRTESPEDAPTFFDATTAAALLCFGEAAVDRAILEVGLGGRLDSTNVVVPRVACVTSIELEHTDLLGTTLAEIAAEKAGILKPGVPVVAGALPEPAAAVVRARAAELGAPMVWSGRDFGADVVGATPRGQRVRLWDGDLSREVELSVLGEHQAGNAALALACVRRSGDVSDAVLGPAMDEGFGAARLPGRVEVLGRGPLRVVDGAHTPASARALAAALRVLPRGHTHLVLSVSAGKDLAEILEALLPLADALTLTRAEATRSLAPAEVAQVARTRAPELAARCVPNPHRALRAALEQLPPGGCALATGSVYLAGIARRVWAEPLPTVRPAVTRGRPESPIAGG
ncbi:MAG: folylpolyglutamate synthase/dihydrofolate synthase family protein [Myxococcota bacterium]|jgi:dihydrofolate synthase/folylpolyglutamate synthase|nr:bifunctional folylpolyglutamate synthase/dihydrofolate synthase [Deltaproteobacteria bacterium]MCP4240728.1 bifunctional folylpolyglutamate synthase/dihydrofolate synthase [bacterium]MDP6075038.1 folylpolyglutamate synthase/dihydrofolate synthase family protein [Myxococcota bacterium]MDP6243313.1 folylpolyglutamate synthase/dihydrofolate synthase family protein [Myxococcota bacterium]MDP7076203.1 folylpolyglutamate synthase/dihydrofolate synthase family protein [Myxococcota bacterium]